MSDEERFEQWYRGPVIPWETGRASSQLQHVVAERQIAPCRALELGCGMGMNAIWLAQHGFDVTAIDISSTALATARSRATEMGALVRFVQGDVLDPPSDVNGPFSFVFDRGCYHHVRRHDVQHYLVTLERLTCPGTLALFLTGNAREARTPGPPAVSEEEIRAELGSLFEIIDLSEFRFDLSPSDAEAFLAWSCFAKRQ
jgi:2-polyprenyl-3-methyl-5-hydroxy-6-metoxy-1,4-benzoquinol methylase